MEQTMNSLMTKHQPQQEEIPADPWDVIPIKNSKVAKETTEVHLGGRKATVLVHFGQFPNLETVWLNDNRLTSLNGLQGNFRIKHLFLQNNKLRSIEGVFSYLRHIETLLLYDNQLRDLDALLACLRPLSSMRHLDLFDNPAAHEPNYKMRVLNDLQQLGILDRHKLTLTEKEEAVRFMNHANGKKKSHRPFAW